MILEMRRALEELGKGEHQGYRKLYDATYEEVYCRGLMILQDEKQTADFMETFYTALFENAGALAIPEQPEHWFWQKYYQEMRKNYHQLLSAQVKGQHCGKSTLAAVPAALPLLHRILLMMSFQDEFSGKEISEIFGLPEEKVESELGKVKNLLPNLTKNQSERETVYTSDWRILIAAAFRQVLTAESDQWVDGIYERAADAAGVKAEEASAKEDDFDYFVADVEVEPEKPKKKKAAPVVEEPEEDDEEEDADDEDKDDEDDEDLDDEDDDDEDDEDDDEDDDRYDWDLEDDNKKMVIIGVILALVIVAVVGFGVKTFLDKSKGNDAAVTTEQEAEDDQEGDAELVIRGDGDSSSDDSSEAEDQQTEETDSSEEETPEEEQPAEEESAEPETVTMKVSASSVNVRSEASTDSSIVTKVTNGETVEVVGDASQEWVQIRCTEQDGKEGYVKSEFLTAAE